jgi:hypothetical protein
MSKVVKILKKLFFTQMFITSSKMNSFELFKDKKLKFKYLYTNWFQSIFEFGFQKLCSFNRKMSLLLKRAKKSKIQKFLYPSGESMFKKSTKSEMVTGRLVDSYKKPLLISHFTKYTKLGKSSMCKVAQCTEMTNLKNKIQWK